MATISTTINVVDRMTSPMQGIISSVQKTIDVLESVDKATDKGFDTSKLTEARRAIDRVNAEYEEVKETIKKTSDNQEQLNQKLSASKASATSFVKGMMGLSVVQKVLSMITGQLDSAMKRMDTMKNFNRTMTAITGDANLAKASLEELKQVTKGTAYGLDTAASAVQNFTTRGMSIGNATSEVAKWADAVAFYGDGTNETLNTVQDALGKMMSKGKVEMEQLNRLTDAGINVVGIYAQATGRSAADVQDDLSKGKISAMDFITTTSTAFEEGTNGVLKIAGAAKEAGGTWATSIANMKAAVTRGLISVIDGINAGLENAGFGTILDGITNTGVTIENMLNKVGTFATNVITLLSPVLNLVRDIGTFISDNWSIIAPIVMGIVTAIGLYNAILIAHNIIEGISNGLKVLSATLSVAKGTATAAEAAATTGATAAQIGFNAALLACPLTWIILAIIAVIAIIYVVIAAINKSRDTTISATGVILGALAAASAFIWNLFLGILDIALAVISNLINKWVAFANFFGNLFNDPVAAIIHLFSDMANKILNILKGIAQAIDKVLGSNLASAVSGWQGTLATKTEAAAKKYGNGSYQKVLDEVNLSSESLGLKRIDYKNAYTAGYNAGEKVDSKIKGVKDALKGAGADSALANLANSSNTTAGNTGNTAKNSGKIAMLLLFQRKT